MFSVVFTSAQQASSEVFPCPGALFLVAGWVIMKLWSIAYSTKDFLCYDSYKPTHLTMHKSESLHHCAAELLPPHTLVHTNIHKSTYTLCSFYLLVKLQKKRKHFCSDDDLIICFWKKYTYLSIGSGYASGFENICKHANFYSIHSLLEQNIFLTCTSNRED